MPTHASPSQVPWGTRGTALHKPHPDMPSKTHGLLRPPATSHPGDDGPGLPLSQLALGLALQDSHLGGGGGDRGVLSVGPAQPQALLTEFAEDSPGHRGNHKGMCTWGKSAAGKPPKISQTRRGAALRS